MAVEGGCAYLNFEAISIVDVEISDCQATSGGGIYITSPTTEESEEFSHSVQNYLIK